MFADVVVEKLNQVHGHMYTFEQSRGRRYTKITRSVAAVAHAQAAHMFIDNETGFFLKPASWSAPAKGVRYAPKNEDEAATIIEGSDPYGNFLYRAR